MNQREYTAFFLFCGLGGFALGAQAARAHLFGSEARFRSLGGVDVDPGACADFEYLTKSPALLADVATLTPGALRQFVGPRAPDAVFDSAPCKSFSGLTNPAIAASQKYVDMADLYVTGVELMLSTWDVGPRLFVKENVPRILSKGAHLIERVTELLERAGYAVHVSTHDCGELGGLAQRRRRALLVARQVRRTPSLLYQPPKRRVRACGEVLGELPLPETPSAGIMHRMPRIGWLTWARLALIPAGQDHRALPGVLAELQKKREAWGRNHVAGWQEPSVTVAGRGSNGATAVADPRATGWHPSAMGVKRWDEPSGTVTGHGHPSGGPFSVSDPRLTEDGRYKGAHAVRDWAAPAATVIGSFDGSSSAVSDPRLAVTGSQQFENSHRVVAWEDPARTVTGEGSRPGSGGQSVQDPRVREYFGGTLGVLSWAAHSGTVTGAASATRGKFSVGDPRLLSAKHPFDHCWRVLPWADPSFTVHGKANVGTGAYSVQDPRDPRFGVIPLEEAAATIYGEGRVRGRFSVGFRERPEEPVCLVDDPKRSPFVLDERGKRAKVPVVIVAADGTWHRPMTPLELGRLQDLPAVVDGEPLQLSGQNVGDWVERVGQAVPAGAAEAMAVQFLLTLLSCDVAAGLAPSGGSVWVEHGFEAAT